MLRDKSLIPLSRQHQHALSLCVRIDRAQPIPPQDLEGWHKAIERHFAEEINIHFSAEEKVLFPSARRFPELVPLVNELMADHARLRGLFAQAQRRTLSGKDIVLLAQKLSAHIRKEERQLFERMQELISAEQLASLGAKLDAALEEAVHVCEIINKRKTPMSRK